MLHTIVLGRRFHHRDFPSHEQRRRREGFAAAAPSHAAAAAVCAEEVRLVDAGRQDDDVLNPAAHPGRRR